MRNSKTELVLLINLVTMQREWELNSSLEAQAWSRPRGASTELDVPLSRQFQLVIDILIHITGLTRETKNLLFF